MNRRGRDCRLTGMRPSRRQVLPVLLLAALFAAGCGEIVVAYDSRNRADLRLAADPTVVRHANGDQEVSGSVLNLGDLAAFDVEVTLTTYVLDAGGTLRPWETVPSVPVFDSTFGTRALFPGEEGTFTVLLLGPRPLIEAVDVEIAARFPSGDFIFFFFSPGLVIIIG